MSILFCTPCYGGMMTTPHFRSCVHLKEDLTKIGIPHDWDTGTNESLVHRARMEIARVFLASQHTHLMWLDADIEFTTDDVAKLWNLETDIAVGVYRMKRKGDLYAAWKDGKLVTDLSQFNGPTEVDYAGTGFMLIKREVIDGVIAYLDRRHLKLKDMAAKVSTLLDDSERAMLSELVDTTAASYMGPHGRSPAIYMTPIYKDGLESEDFNFSRIAREAGFKVIMDPTVKLIHWGQFGYGHGA